MLHVFCLLIILPMQTPMSHAHIILHTTIRSCAHKTHKISRSNTNKRKNTTKYAEKEQWCLEHDSLLGESIRRNFTLSSKL